MLEALPILRSLEQPPEIRTLCKNTFFDDPEYLHTLPDDRIKGLICELILARDTDFAFVQGDLILKKNPEDPVKYALENAIALYALALRLIDHHTAHEKIPMSICGQKLHVSRRHVYVEGMMKALKLKYKSSQVWEDYEEALRWHIIGLDLARKDTNSLDFPQEALAHRLWSLAAWRMEADQSPLPHEPFERLSEFTASKQVVELLEEADKLATTTHLKVHIATNLSLALYAKYSSESSPGTVLDEAIERGMNALNVAQDHGFACISDLSVSFYIRWSDMFFDRACKSYDIADYQSSLKYCKLVYERTNHSECYLLRLCGIKVGTAASMSPEYTAGRAPLEHKQGSSQYKLLDEVKQDLEKALRTSVTASSRTKAGWRVMLGIAFIFAGGKTNVQHAIEHLTKAVDCEVCRCPEHGLTWNARFRLSEAHAHLAFNTRQHEDYQKALNSWEDTAKHLQAPENCEIKRNIADLAMELYKSNPASQFAYGERSLSVMLQCLECPKHQALPQRIWLLGNAAKLYMQVRKDGNNAVELITKAIALLPHATQPQSTRFEQLRMIRKFFWLSHSALNISIFAGIPLDQAVSLYESSHGILWERLVTEKGISSLPNSLEDDLVERLRRAQLATNSRPHSNDNHETAAELARLQKHHNVDKYVDVLESFRARTGVAEQFGLFKKESFQRSSCNGPIVIVNSSFGSMDAVVISRRKIYTRNLPLLDKYQTSSMMEALVDVMSARSLETKFDFADRTFQYILTWFWQVLAKPLLDSIDFSDYVTANGEKPRIYWVSTGLLALLPMHAVGDWCAALRSTRLTVTWTRSQNALCPVWHEQATGVNGTPPKSDSVHARVVSSYIPNLRALKYIRDRDTAQRAAFHSHEQSILLVGMPKTPGAKDLNALHEIQTIKESTSSLMSSIMLENPTKSEVIDALGQCNIAHFACHGRADPNDPSLSCIKLQDWQMRPLNVRSLLQAKMPRCRLAFISACESMQVKDWRLHEEGVHIAGGFLMAGVPNVISTMWPVDDGIANRIALCFYDFFKADDATIDCSKSAIALHNAVDGLISSKVPPILWGAYTHTGI